MSVKRLNKCGSYIYTRDPKSSLCKKQTKNKLIERVNNFQERVLNIKGLEVKKNNMGGRAAELVVEIISAEKH